MLIVPSALFCWSSYPHYRPLVWIITERKKKKTKDKGNVQYSYTEIEYAKSILENRDTVKVPRLETIWAGVYGVLLLHVDFGRIWTIVP
jgi:hypothetical protein